MAKMSLKEAARAERAAQFNPAVNEIRGIYARAEDRLDALLLDMDQMTEPKQARITALNRQVREITQGLDKFYTDWAKINADKSYTEGVDFADRIMLEQGVKTNPYTRIHQQAIISLAADMALEMAEANSSINRIFRRYIRYTKQRLVSERALSSIIAEGLVEGATRRTISSRIEDELRAKLRNGQYVRAGSKLYKPSEYAELVARTRLAEAQTEGLINMSILNGVDLVQVTFHASTPDDLCRSFEKKIFSITGESDRFPPLKERPPFHPNCVHRLVPITEEKIEAEGI